MKNLNVKIPDGCKSVSIRVEDGKIITEFIPKGKVASYEDALGVLGLKSPKWMDNAPRHIKAQYKLETICEALNIGHTGKDRIYFPFWWDKKSLLGGSAYYGAHVGLGYVNSDVRFSDAHTNIGSRLCSFDEETAIYFGSKPFIKLWQEYLL